MPLLRLAGVLVRPTLSPVSAYVFAMLGWLVFPQIAPGQWVVLHDQNGYFTRNIPDEAFKKLGDFAKQGAALNCISFTPSGGWVILINNNEIYARNIPGPAFNKAGELVTKNGAKLKSISFAPGGGWVIFYDKNGFAARDIPDEASNKLKELAKNGAELTSISFTPGGGWVILHDKNGLYARNIPDEAYAKLGELQKQGAALKDISFTPSGGWVILHDKNNLYARGIPDETYSKLGELQKQGATLKSVAFTPRPYLQLSRDDAKTRKEILARLAHHKVPGISIALIQGGKVEWARAFGLARDGEEKTLTGKSRFQAASISKPVAALAALLLAQQKKVELDRDLNAQLVSWLVPDNEFIKKQRPTIRQVLSHSAGFNVHGFPGYATGTPLPSLLEILDGKKPANTPAIRVVLVPGTKFQYSGGGYCVLQDLLVDVTRTAFPKLMQEQVLGPLGMKLSTYAQPLPREWEAEAAVAHDSAGKPFAGNWNIYPEMAAAGLWTTPSDLALFVLALSRAQQGDKDAILTSAMAKAMFAPQLGNYGLGIALNGKDRSLSFSHNGSNAGYRCQFIGFPATGQGAALMTNSDNGDALLGEFLENLRTEYAWPG
jgi:CubicO group peptidase (beta-lactamase class C family)